MKSKSLLKYLAVPLVALASYFPSKALDIETLKSETLQKYAIANTIYMLDKGNDIYDGSTPELAVRTPKRAVDIANTLGSISTANQIYVGEGNFKSLVPLVNPTLDDFVINYFPLEIKGYGEKPKIDAYICSFDYIGYENIELHGDNNPNIQTFSKNLAGGYINNCTLKDYPYIVINTDEPFLISDNKFTGVEINPYAKGVIIYDKPHKRNFNKSNEPDMILSNGNLFSNIPNVFYLYSGVDAGTEQNIGGNVFENCGTIINNVGDNNQFFSGNYWVDNAKGKYVYTDPNEILENKVINQGTGQVNVNNPLRWNPLCKPTDLNEDYKTDSIDVQLVINNALGLENPEDIKPTDVDGDGYITASDVQLTINDALK